MQWYGKPVNFNRFLGQVDQDDPTNLPIGAAALCRNTDFTRDSPGVTSAGVRAGLNLAMQLVGLDGRPSQDPATGGISFVYEPQLESDVALFPPAGYFAMPILFEGGGCLQREYPVGTGRCQKLPASALFTPPVHAHMMGVAAANKVWAAFSDLEKPLSRAVCIDPKAVLTGVAPLGTQAVNPLGMRPVGWYWAPNTQILAGEVCCPAAPNTGNGHTYQAQNSGTTGALEPAWPLTEGGTVVDNPGPNQITWKEKTMVMANRLPAPAPPTFAVGAGGALPSGFDVYFGISLVNPQGESLMSTPVKVPITAPNQTVTLNLPASGLPALPGWIATLGPQYKPTSINIYTAAVASGFPAPPISAFQLEVTVAFATVNQAVAALGAGAAPPTKCTARITAGQLPTPDTPPPTERVPGAGAFAAGLDVYILKTYRNALGETKGGPATSIVGTVLNDAVAVTVDVPVTDLGAALFSIQDVGIYEADVPTGTPAPDPSEFSLVGYYSAGAAAVVTATAAGPNPPTSNGTGPGGDILADSPTGGPNGTEGYHYAVLCFMNQNETVSGFTVASAVKCDVDEDGWELAFFNVLTGPGNTVARLICPTPANASQLGGPWNWLGVINLLVPSRNVVYPMQTLVDGSMESATAILDNVTGQATVNFTESFLNSGNSVIDRTAILAPFLPQRIDFLKTINALAYEGVAGYSGGLLVSISGDLESVRADTGAVPFPADGQQCFGVTDAYKSTIFALRGGGPDDGGSGYVIQPNSGAPSGWDAVQRWSECGPCGFRAWAATGKFIIFVHRSGVYKYDESDPDMMSKEVPRKWSTVNWAVGHKIAVTIDEDTHTVRIQVPTGESTENNEEFCLSYLEGWQAPIHFSTFSGREITLDAARRWSFNDCAATMCVRMARKLPPGPAFLQGPDWSTLPDSSYKVSQLLFLDSSPDGGVQARTPGVYSDNGTGIDWQWESTCAGMMQAVCKPEGLNLNVAGHGRIYASLLAARNRADQGGKNKEIPLGPGYFDLVEGQQKGITLKCRPSINEFYRMRFTNGKIKGNWASLKSANLYLIPFTVGRGERDR